ncbi:class I glutamine amidotransferase-like protein [Aspergillus ambiguus]|uniref:class I glutamine amidotransferase-like protein n=1 Tax=Aspergillus ambiguus TaxID=176160 RepID=UPI003CCE5189
MTQQQGNPDFHLIGTFTRYSSWTARVETVLEYFQIPYTAKTIQLADVRKVSKTGLVPLLECRSLGDNIRINDSLAICEFLAESNPHLDLWPRDRQLRALARSAAAEMHSGFQTIRNTYQSNFVARFTGNIPITEQGRKEIERLLTLWDTSRKFTKARLAELGESDEGFLFGAFSIADAFFWPVLWRFRTYDLPLDTANNDALAWMETMWNDPTMRRLSSSYYRQADRPESRIAHYDDIFKGYDDIQAGQFPEDWTFTRAASGHRLTHRFSKLSRKTMNITVGVLALQGAFYEHVQLLKQAATGWSTASQWHFIEVRTPQELERCDALILPGGESTTMSLVAARSNLLEPLREFVKVHRKPTWGTCAGLILLAESANRTKKGGQELIGGLDVRVNRNHFGRQTESFQAPLDLPFLDTRGKEQDSFPAVFIRAPVVEKILPHQEGTQTEETQRDETVVAPSKAAKDAVARDAMATDVEVLATLPGRAARLVASQGTAISPEKEAGDIVAVRQGNVFGTSFHPELTGDARIHSWWLRQVEESVKRRLEMEQQ